MRTVKHSFVRGMMYGDFLVAAENKSRVYLKIMAVPYMFEGGSGFNNGASITFGARKPLIDNLAEQENFNLFDRVGGFDMQVQNPIEINCPMTDEVWGYGFVGNSGVGQIVEAIYLSVLEIFDDCICSQ